MADVFEQQAWSAQDQAGAVEYPPESRVEAIKVVAVTARALGVDRVQERAYIKMTGRMPAEAVLMQMRNDLMGIAIEEENKNEWDTASEE